MQQIDGDLWEGVGAGVAGERRCHNQMMLLTWEDCRNLDKDHGLYSAFTGSLHLFDEAHK